MSIDCNKVKLELGIEGHGWVDWFLTETLTSDSKFLEYYQTKLEIINKLKSKLGYTKIIQNHGGESQLEFYKDFYPQGTNSAVNRIINSQMLKIEHEHIWAFKIPMNELKWIY